MATQSKFPSGEQMSRPMQAYLQNMESRRPSDGTALNASLNDALDGATLLPDLVAAHNTLVTAHNELAAAYNQLIQDLNK